MIIIIVLKNCKNVSICRIENNIMKIKDFIFICSKRNGVKANGCIFIYVLAVTDFPTVIITSDIWYLLLVIHKGKPTKFNIPPFSNEFINLSYWVPYILKTLLWCICGELLQCCCSNSQYMLGAQTSRDRIMSCLRDLSRIGGEWNHARMTSWLHLFIITTKERQVTL